ncbi:MAG: hypothetical protein LBI42_13965 [Chitinispirillales bacterium]|jgi:hypothetical protein|nr:hypothetical protein [Chitinispirillales bacterium]
MANEVFMNRSVEMVPWQDYRASNTGMVVFYAGDPVSELPIREVPEEYPSDIQPEPNYETGTFGFYGCARSKIRSTFVKSKIRYLLFITKYIGTNADFKDEYLITGFYRVTKITDAKKQHLRFCSDYSCIDENVCYALRAEESRFVSAKDAFRVTPQLLKEWGFKGRVTRQSRIILNEEQAAAILGHLSSKPDIKEQYIEETARLQPRSDEESEE